LERSLPWTSHFFRGEHSEAKTRDILTLRKKKIHERTSGCSFCDVIFLVNNNNQTTTFSAVLDTFTDAAADDDTVGKEMDGVVVVLVAAREWFLF
jgi:hypothetical protein